jgi:hypothetical protein
VAGVVAPGEREQLRYGAQRVERVAVIPVSPLI